MIGTNRHDSRRVDLQLRGRAGRQGDPGESRCFVSLEDDLLARFGSRSPVPARMAGREIAHIQRIADGQNFDIRRTLSRYSGVLEYQYEQIGERRRAMLSGEDTPDIWSQDPERRGSLVAAAGEEAVVDAERTVTIACIDRAWRDHLAYCADLREGIHLVRLGGADPLAKFSMEAIRAFGQLDAAIDAGVLEALAAVRAVDGKIDLTVTGLKAPSSTWTYLINDDPFQHRIGMALTRPGGVTHAIYAGAMLMPLLILWGWVERAFARKRRKS